VVDLTHLILDRKSYNFVYGIISKAGDPDHLSQVQIDHLRPKAIP